VVRADPGKAASDAADKPEKRARFDKHDAAEA
jgi:hypothetical protein